MDLQALEKLLQYGLISYKPASIAGRFIPGLDYRPGEAKTPQVLSIHHECLMPYTELQISGASVIKYPPGACFLETYATLIFCGSAELSLPTREQGASVDWKNFGSVICWATYQGEVDRLAFPIIFRTDVGFNVVIPQLAPVEVRIYVHGTASLHETRPNCTPQAHCH